MHAMFVRRIIASLCITSTIISPSVYLRQFNVFTPALQYHELKIRDFENIGKDHDVQHS